MLQLKTFTLAELCEHADRWNDLWQRSEVRLPTTRAQGIKLWCQSFATDRAFTALVVESEGEFVAALPLVRESAFKLFTVYRLPNNCTVSAGDLLVDPNCNVQRVTELLADEVCRLPATCAAFENIAIESDRWQRFIAALDAQKRQLHISPGHDVGVIDIFHDWKAYTKYWSRNHRRSLNRAGKKLEASGKVEVSRLVDPSDEQLYETLEACFVIEDAGWKGANGTSILQTSRLRDYYHLEAKWLRDEGMLDLWLLKLDDQIIAFDYTQLSKTTSFSHKISFDPKWEKCSPGRALQMYQLEQYHEDPAVALVDTLGVHCDVKAKWTTRTYKSSRCFAAVGSRWSNLMLKGFKLARRLAKAVGRAETIEPRIEPGAADYWESERPKSESRPESPVAPLPIAIPLPAESTPEQSAS